MRREDLFGHFERELLYLRRAGQGFARAFPKVARRLALGPDEAGDPHVERLIESFAFLAARLQLNLDRQFPRFTDALLGILYPHLTAPIPACGIARFEPDPTNGQMTDGHVIDRGAPLVALAGADVRCRFTTTMPVTIWPLTISRTSVRPADTNLFPDGAVAGALRLDIAAMNTVVMDGLPVKKLRLFINAEPSVVASVYEALTSTVVEAVFESEGRETARVKRGVIIEAAGFDDQDTLFPHPTNGHPAYRLLLEYFAFPQKFLFLDLFVPEGALKGLTSSVVLGLSRPLPERLQLRADTLLLGCAPVVNLFSRIAEPIRVDQRRNSYPVVADSLRERITEVYAVQSVTGIRSEGLRVPYVPLFSAEHAKAGESPDAFWHTDRDFSLREDATGTETWLHLFDSNLDPAKPAAETLLVTTLCTNRGLAEEVPAGAALIMEDAAPVSGISLLYKPTMPRYRAADGDTAWKMVSQMALNHLSLSSGQDSLRALQEILTLHALDDPAARAQISALRVLEVEPTVARIGKEAWRGFCRGLLVTIETDERGFVGASPLVFGEVMSRFLGLYVGLNSFTQLRFRSLQRQGIWRTWQRMAGARQVL